MHLEGLTYKKIGGKMEEKEIWKPLFEESIKKDLGKLDGVFLVSNLGRIKDWQEDSRLK